MSRDKRDIVIYGSGMALLLLILNRLEIRYLIYGNSLEVLLGAVALIFTILGIWVANQLIAPKVLIVEKEIIVERGPEFNFNQRAFIESGLSERELEVLKEMALGLSNKEIADKLHVSVPTIKSHAYNLYEKLDVRRRTQAIERGKYLKIIP